MLQSSRARPRSKRQAAISAFEEDAGQRDSLVRTHTQIQMLIVSISAPEWDALLQSSRPQLRVEARWQLSIPEAEHASQRRQRLNTHRFKY
jgi:hypothetical protein